MKFMTFVSVLLFSVLSIAQGLKSPNHPCLTGKRLCKLGTYLATHPYVFGGRTPDGRQAVNRHTIVGKCETKSSFGRLVLLNDKVIANYSGPHQAGSHLKRLIKAGKCFKAGEIRGIQNPLHPCLTGQKICAKGRYLKTHSYVLGGRTKDGRSAVNNHTIVGNCATKSHFGRIVILNEAIIGRYSGPGQAGARLKKLIANDRCF